MNRKEELFLAGGGDRVASKEVDDYLVRRVKESGLSAVAYIPLAMTSRPYSDCLTWFKSIFEGRIENIQMWDKLANISINEMRRFGAVYIGGGNTVTLWSHIQEADFGKLLREYVKGGGIVYGGSAGAIILGKDLRTAPEVKKASLDNYEGLNFLGGYSVVCHYDPLERDAAKELVEVTNSSIIAIPEDSGVIRSGKELLIVGGSPVNIFTKTNLETLEPRRSR